MTAQSSAGGALCDQTASQIGGLDGFAGFGSKIVLDSNPRLPFSSPWGVADKTLLQSSRVGEATNFSGVDVGQCMTTRVRQASSDIAPGESEAEGGDLWYNRTGQTVKSGQWFVQVRGAVFGDTMVSEVPENLEDRVAREMPDSTGGWTWETVNTTNPAEFITHPASDGVLSNIYTAGGHLAFAFCPEPVGNDQFAEFELIQNPSSLQHMGIALRADGVESYYRFYARTNDVSTAMEVVHPGGAVWLANGPQVVYDSPFRFEVTGFNPVIVRCKEGAGPWVTHEHSGAYQLQSGRAGLYRINNTTPDQGVYKRLRFGSA